MGYEKALLSTTTYSDTEELIYDDQNLVLVGVTFKGRTGGDSAIDAGTLVGTVTADSTYQVYDDSATDGTETAVGIVIEDVPALAAGEEYNAVIAIHGDFYKSKITGYDAAALADLNGKVVKKGSVEILSF